MLAPIGLEFVTFFLENPRVKIFQIYPLKFAFSHGIDFRGWSEFQSGGTVVTNITSQNQRFLRTVVNGHKFYFVKDWKIFYTFEERKTGGSGKIKGLILCHKK